MGRKRGRRANSHPFQTRGGSELDPSEPPDELDDEFDEDLDDVEMRDGHVHTLRGLLRRWWNKAVAWIKEDLELD